MKSFFLSILALLACVVGVSAQVVTTEPSPLLIDANNVVVYFHADQGNKGLINTPASSAIYAHTGVITSASTSDSDWKFATTWGSNLAKYKMEYVSENLWKLNIGNIRTFYNIPATEEVKSLVFVFRDSTGSKTGKDTGSKDIVVPVISSGFQLFVDTSIEGDVITGLTADATFNISTTEPADIKFYINNVELASADMATSLTVNHFFEPLTKGGYIVRVTAKNEEEKFLQFNKRYTWAEASPEVDYPGGTPVMGPVRNADGSVTFCIGAPEKAGIYLLGSWNGFEADENSIMNLCTVDGIKYFWKTVPALADGQNYFYCFLINGTTYVGDPYARLVLDPSNDKYISAEVYPDMPTIPADAPSNVAIAVYNSGLNDYNWKVTDFKRPAKDNLVIYEMLFRDFTGTEGSSKGNGTVRQAIEKIPYLKQLGVNAVEVLPINEFNGNISWGYNPNFYFAPDKAYGTPDDYKEFIDKCHAAGIAVILDVVFNQSDWQHPWYKMYTVGANPMFNADAPHAYSVLNDWNQGHPLVRQQWKDCVQYWLKEYNVDGFRFDLVKGLGDNDSYANNGDSGTNAYNASRVANMKAITLAIQEIEPDAYCINENLAGAKEENDMAAFGMLNWANVNYSGCQYAKGIASNTNFNRFYAPFDGARKIGSTVSYLESHDEQRLAYEQDTYGIEAVKGNVEVSMHRLGSAAAQMIMAPGSHMIWQFSEMGNAQSTKNATGGNNTDPKKVNWALLDDPDHKGLMENYAELIHVRLANQDMYDITAGAKVNLKCTDSAWATGRSITNTLGDKELYTVINPNVEGGNISVEIPFKSDNNADYYIVSKSYNSNPTFSAQANTVTVAPNCYVTIASNTVSSAVKSLKADTASLMIRGVRGGLVIDNAVAPVAVFAADGRCVANLSAGTSSLNLPAGIYVVTSAGESAKVAVK